MTGSRPCATTQTARSDTSFGTGGQAKTNYGSFLYAYASDVVVLSDGRAGGGRRQQLPGWSRGVVPAPRGTLLGQEQTGGIGDGLHWVNDLVAKPGGRLGDRGRILGGVPRRAGQVSDEARRQPGYVVSDVVNRHRRHGRQAGRDRPGWNGLLQPNGLWPGCRPVRRPGITHSPTTFVQSLTLTDPAPGPLVLAAAVIPLLGNGPLTEGTVVFREGSTVVGTLDLSAATAPGGMYSFSILVTLPAGTHTITADFTGTANWDPSSTTLR